MGPWALAPGLLAHGPAPEHALARGGARRALPRLDLDAGGAGGTLELYVLRFRTIAPHWRAHEGWMAGVAGPHRRGGGPYLLGPSAGSAFEPADAKSAADHAGPIPDVLATWRASRPPPR